MAIIIDGVALPDLPAEILTEYPYALIYQFNLDETNTTYLQRYVATFAKAPLVYVPYNLIDANNTTVKGRITTDTLGYGGTYMYIIGDAKWSSLGLTPSTTSEFMGCFDGYMGSGDTYAAYYPKWANHTIYVASAYDSSTKPDTVTITSDIYTPGKGIGYDISGLPDIPDGVLEKYPFMAIGRVAATDGTISYVMLGTTSGLIIFNNTFIMTVSDGYVVYTCTIESTEWSLYGESSANSFVNKFDTGKYTILASNHTIFSLNSDIEEIIPYFERTIYPEIELPPIPQEFINSYPYVLVARLYANGIALVTAEHPDVGLAYGLVMSSEPVIFGEIGYNIFAITEGHGNIVYVLNTDTLTWNIESESSSNIIMSFENNQYVNFEITSLWANHDIVFINGVDENDNPITSGLYYAGDEHVSPPSSYSIDRLKILAMAQQVRRHNDFSLDPLTITEMAPILNSVAILDDAEGVAY